MSGAWWKDPSELIQEQVDILDLDLDASLLIKGPPGSGKTNLLLLRANHLFLADRPNLNVVVFGSVLRDFIKTGAEQYKFPPDKIATHSRLFAECIQQYGGFVDAKNLDFNAARQARRVALAELLSAGKIGYHLQALLLDEAQDYLPEEMEIALKLSPIVVAACDAKQKIYDGESCLDILESNVAVCKELKYHFRNGRSICRAADAIMADQVGYVPMIERSQYDEEEYPSMVTVNPGVDLQQQVALISERVAKQLEAYPGERIGVILPKNSDVNDAVDLLVNSPVSKAVTRCGTQEFDATRSVWVSTMAGAKGLEFRAVHLAALDGMSRMGANQRRLAFTSVTRAKTVLSLYYHKNVPGYLDRAIRLFVPQSSAVTKNMIFGVGQ